MKRKDLSYELLLENMSRIQEEKAMLQQQNNELLARLSSMEESYKAELAAMRDTQHALMAQNTSLQQSLETMRLTMEQQIKINATLSEQLANALSTGKLSQGKRFAPTTEQRDLLNNRRIDGRGRDRDDFDGTNPPASGTTTESRSCEHATPKQKKKSKGRRPSIERYDCDETIVHELADYFKLPEGAKFKTRNGETEIYEWIQYEFIPGRIVRHVWQTACYINADGDCCKTLPQEERDNPVKGCPFSAEMLAFLLVEKYGYHTPKKRIRIKLREMGARFPKTTFNHYYQLAESELRAMLEATLREAVADCSYLMIDETSVLVGTENEKTGVVEYLKKYLWAFHNKCGNLVSYVYEGGSRAREVVLNFLQKFKGTISTDGYNAYSVFDDDRHPDILHCGCWSHARRKTIEMIGVESEVGYKLLDEIDALFDYERRFKGMQATEKMQSRQKLSNHVLNRILTMAKSISTDTILMGKELVKKAVNYILTQWDSLRNFLRDGNAEISNNLCEQRMKPIKLDLKNCQNIGSQGAAENAAFMHSLVESCRLNGKDPYAYLCHLFRKLKSPPDHIGKRDLLPDRWMPVC
ncbi:MAG: IS66 family transposase [Muribaculaceae bacterium]|nr:IS66 family transposase [Muribaculaceae bacterium]